MPNYRRHRVPGGTYFFTVNLLERKRSLLVDEIESLRAAVRKVRAAQPFAIDCWVVLPDHMHSVWTLPPGDADYSSRWKAIIRSRCSMRRFLNRTSSIGAQMER